MYIDLVSKQTVTIKRKSRSQDGSGDWGVHSETTLFSNVVADIQSVDDKLLVDMSGYTDRPTHIMFTQTRLTGIRVMDYVNDGTDDFMIIGIEDYGDHFEYMLRKQ